MKHLLHMGMLVACLIILAGCNGGSDSSPTSEIALSVQSEPKGDITDSIGGEPEFKVFSSALASTGMNALLKDPTRGFTVFAPTDQVFAAMGEETVSTLFSDPETLSYIVSYHILADQNVDTVAASTLVGSSLTASNNVDLQVTVAPSRNTQAPQALYINDAEIFVADVPATNGTIHAIDRLLLPPEIVASLGGSNMNPDSGVVDDGAGNADEISGDTAGSEGSGSEGSGSEGTGSEGTGSEGTGSEGTGSEGSGSEGTGSEGTGSEGSGSEGSGSEGTGSEGTGSEGTGSEGTGSEGTGSEGTGSEGTGSEGTGSEGTGNEGTETAGTGTEGTGNEGSTLLQVAAAQSDLSTFVSALQRTGLDTLLSDTSKTFTIFAPTDTAFNTFDPFELVLNNSTRLENTLLYHVVEGEEIDAATATSLATGSITMANGKSVIISSSGASLFLNYYARIQTTDIRAGNGIIHKISGVLFTTD